jgi:hypothetical protein
LNFPSSDLLQLQNAKLSGFHEFFGESAANPAFCRFKSDKRSAFFLIFIFDSLYFIQHYLGNLGNPGKAEGFGLL